MKRFTIPSLLLAFLLLFSTFGYAQTIVLQENFEGAFPPPGWSVVNNVVGGTWQDNVTRGVPNYCAAGSGDCAVAHPGDTNTSFWDTELRTPPIDLSNATWAALTYASMFQDYAGNGEIWVDISTDGGTTWVSLRNQTSDDPPGGTPAVGGTSEIEDLAGYLGHTVIIRWRFQAGNSAAWCFHVDNVEIQAVLAVFPTVTAITPDNGPIEGGTMFTITGTDFSAGAVVTFGGYKATLYYVDSTTIAGQTPPHPNGTVDVMVTNPDGRGGTLAGGFTYGNIASGTIPDFDGDGVSDRKEQGCNNAQSDYDGNGDHIPDYMQVSAATFTVFDPDGVAICMTMAVPEGHQLFRPLAEASQNTPQWQRFPYGLFSVRHIELNRDTDTMLTLFADGSSIQSYWLYGKTPDNPTDHWYSFMYDGQTGAEIMTDRILLHFVDGERGDNDLSANGFISQHFGGPSEGIQRAELFYPYLGSNHSAGVEMGLINLDPYLADVALDYYNSNGELITTTTMHLNGMGKVTIPCEATPADAASAIVVADANLAGYTRSIGTAGQRCAWSAHDSLCTSVAVPHVANNSEWRTMIAVFNPSDKMTVMTAIHASGAFIEYYVKPFGQLILWPEQEDPLSFLEADTGIAAVEIIENLGSQGDFSALMLTNRLLGEMVVPYLPQGAGSFTGVGLQNRTVSGVIGIFGYTQSGEINAAFTGEWLPYVRNAFSLDAVLGQENQWARIVGRSTAVNPFGRLPMYMDGLVIYAQVYPSSLAGVNLNTLRFTDGYLGMADVQTAVALANANLTDATVTVTGFGRDGAVTGTGVLLLPMVTNRVLGVQDLLGDTDPEQITHIRIKSDVSLSGLEIVTTDGRMEVLPILKAP